MNEINQILSEGLVDAHEAAYCLKMPLYLFTHPQERARLGIPHYRVGKMVRFKVSELMAWMQVGGEKSDA